MINESSTYYDSLFEQENIHFYPYVGKEYVNTNDISKTLLLGESHYYGDCDVEKNEIIDNDHNFTRECFIEQYNAFTNIESILAGSLFNYEYITDKICFYNFCRNCVGYFPSDKQFEKQYRDQSRIDFFKIIKILKPSFVIAFGTSYLRTTYMPHNKAQRTIIQVNGNPRDLTYYYNEYPFTKIIHIRHPSRDTDLCKTAQQLQNFYNLYSIKLPL